ncbi:MAG TPA: RelA/SpoT domain-containing protein [Longimicrobium sp.]|nr:RelA/SpoT domain-containing protein [Longimicrobium sp.]
MATNTSERSEKQKEIEVLEAEYRIVAPLAQRFAAELTHQLDRLILDRSISLSIPIQSRVKKWESIVEKIDRKSLPLKSVRDLPDLVGVRLILQFRRDISAISEMLIQHFSVVERDDAQERLKDDQFGYSSIHFSVELPDVWLAVPTLSEMRGLRAEVQVRTTAQHIWAAASHTLQYKQEDSVPPPVRRSIYRVSALLETIDLEFERVLEQRDSYRSTAALSSPDAPLDVDLLQQILDEILPAENKSRSEPYAELLEELHAFEIRTRKQLESILKEHRGAAILEDKRTANRIPEFARNRSMEMHGRPTNAVWFTHVGLTRNIFKLEYGTRWEKFFTEKKLKRAETTA